MLVFYLSQNTSHMFVCIEASIKMSEKSHEATLCQFAFSFHNPLPLAPTGNIHNFVCTCVYMRVTSATSNACSNTNPETHSSKTITHICAEKSAAVASATTTSNLMATHLQLPLDKVKTKCSP